MHKSAKRGWISKRAVQLVLQRTGCVGEVLVDEATLASEQGRAWYLTGGDRGPCRYQGHPAAPSYLVAPAGCGRRSLHIPLIRHLGLSCEQHSRLLVC